MTRAEWQQLAEDRILDAQALAAAAAPRWSAVFYLAGYAVECGLKSCILVRIAANPEVIFQDKRFSQDCWTHDIESLVVLADLKASATLTRRLTRRCTRIGSGPKTGLRRHATSKRPRPKPNNCSTLLPIRTTG